MALAGRLVSGPGEVETMDIAIPPPVVRTPEIEEAIRRRAEKLYEERGRAPGHEVEDWVKAEAEVLHEIEIESAPKPAFVSIRFEGAVFTGEYDAKRCDGYVPGEFRAAAPVEIRFETGKMYVKRPNGKELETRVVRKEGYRWP